MDMMVSQGMRGSRSPYVASTLEKLKRVGTYLINLKYGVFVGLKG